MFDSGIYNDDELDDMLKHGRLSPTNIISSDEDLINFIEAGKEEEGFIEGLEYMYNYYVTKDRISWADIVLDHLIKYGGLKYKMHKLNKLFR